jgi:hypothetical protein
MYDHGQQIEHLSHKVNDDDCRDSIPDAQSEKGWTDCSSTETESATLDQFAAGYPSIDMAYARQYVHVGRKPHEEHLVPSCLDSFFRGDRRNATGSL